MENAPIVLGQHARQNRLRDHQRTPQIDAVHGIEIRKEGSDEFLYLSNTWTKELKLVKADLKGEKVWSKGRPECKEYEDPKVNYNPTNICFLPDGGFNVGDGYGSNFMPSLS